MWQERQAEFLKNEIEAVLESLPNEGGLRDLVTEPLTKSRRGLFSASTYDRRWPLLPLVVCESISSLYNYAVPAAAALQFLLAAGDVFDDIEDADCCESLSKRYGPAVATNVATTLLILAQSALTRLREKSVEAKIIVHLIATINSFYSTACAGQHLDLSINQCTTISEDLYIRIIKMKSASQVECACYVGAFLGGADQKLIDTFTKFGQNLGLAAQIANDLQGITQGRDLMKNKISLPVIYALTQTDIDIRKQLISGLSKSSKVVSETDRMMDVLFRSGSVHYAAVKMELYKQLAIDCLSQAKIAGANIERLKTFIT